MLASFLLAVAASAYMLVAPSGSAVSGSVTVTDDHPRGTGAVSVEHSMGPDGEVVVRETRIGASGRTEVRRYHRPAPQAKTTTLLESKPGPVLSIVAFATVVTGLPLVLDRTRLRGPLRIVAAALMVSGSLVGSMSFGVFYAPSAIAMTLAAARRDR